MMQLIEKHPSIKKGATAEKSVSRFFNQDNGDLQGMNLRVEEKLVKMGLNNLKYLLTRPLEEVIASMSKFTLEHFVNTQINRQEASLSPNQKS